MRWVLWAAMLTTIGATSSAAEAKPPLRWVVMPARADHPPPADPTLLRLSTPLAEVLARVVAGPVRLASRQERDDRCRDQGWRCPDEIARMLEVDRVVSLQLSEDLDRLDVIVFAGRVGVTAHTQIACEWSAGRLTCDLEALSTFVEGLGPRPLDPEAVFSAFEALMPRLKRCAALRKVPREVFVGFRVGPEGRSRDVRVEPRDLERDKAHACMARVVEGLTVPAHGGEIAGPFRFALP